MSVLSYADTKVQTACGQKAYLSATPKTGSHFVCWDDGNKSPTREVIIVDGKKYTAIFAWNKYEIVFQNADGTQLQKDSVEYSQKPEYIGELPTLLATPQYTFTFVSWYPTITNATKDQVYTALFDTVVNSYLITFKNADGNILQSSNWKYGELPVYSGTAPTKPVGAWTYTFKTWDSDITSVSGPATYIARYDSVSNDFMLTTKIEGDGVVSGAGTYQYGTVVGLSATAKDCYQFTKWSDGVLTPSRFVKIQSDTTFTAHFELLTYEVEVVASDTSMGEVSIEMEKELSGLFSVSATQQVQFSKGNLQYQVLADKWRFADNQYDYVGDMTYGNVYVGTEKSSNTKIAVAGYTGWIDLFGWGTATNPTNISKNANLFIWTGDWGQNTIGLYAANTWRTMSKEELDYLFSKRLDAKKKVSRATVNGIYGIILLPDSWTLPSGLSFVASASTFSINNYLLAEWKKMEDAGAVFLPCAGFRPAESYVNSGSFGGYWSATSVGNNAYGIYFAANEVSAPYANMGRISGWSVRLVRVK